MTSNETSRDLTLSLLNSEIESINGLPQPQWDRIARRVDALPSDQQDDAWLSVIENWLEQMAQSLGGGSNTHAYEDMRLLSSAESDQGDLLVKWSVNALRKITGLVGDHRTLEMRGPRVVLLFSDIERYYDYADRYYSDGEHSSSGGMCICSGYIHVIIGRGDLFTRQIILAHELTHLALAPVVVPTWVDEGLAQVMEQALTGYAGLEMNREVFQRHAEFWRAHGLDSYWSGESFATPGDSSELSYSLAEVMIRNALSLNRSRFMEFIQAAAPEDSGNAAALQYMGRSVAELASSFLGHGDWEPPGDMNVSDAPPLL